MRCKVKEEEEVRKMHKKEKCECNVCDGKGTVKETDKKMTGFLFVTDEEINEGYRRVGLKKRGRKQ